MLFKNSLNIKLVFPLPAWELIINLIYESEWIYNMNNKNLFIVNTEVMAKAILCLTEIKFNKYNDKFGNTRYTLPRQEIIFKAYQYILDFKNK